MFLCVVVWGLVMSDGSDVAWEGGGGWRVGPDPPPPPKGPPASRIFLDRTPPSPPQSDGGGGNTPPPPGQRVRMCGGERPIGTAKGKQSDPQGLVPPPPPPRGQWRRPPSNEAHVRIPPEVPPGGLPQP